MATTTMEPTTPMELGEEPAIRALSPAPGAPRWARRAAVLAVLTTIPSALWRIAMAVGVPVGVSEAVLTADYGFPGWGTVYAFALSVLLVGLGCLSLGLVQRWGEVVPGWAPLIGGRSVPVFAVAVPASVGAVLLTVLWITATANLGQIAEEFGLEGAALAVVFACYSPLLAWGPLLAAVTVSYVRRRRIRG